MIIHQLPINKGPSVKLPQLEILMMRKVYSFYVVIVVSTVYEVVYLGATFVGSAIKEASYPVGLFA